MTEHQRQIVSVANEQNGAPGERTKLSETGSASELRPGQRKETMQIPVRRARRIRRKRKGRKHGQHAVRLGR